MELALCVKLLHKLFISVDLFIKAMAESWIFTNAKRKLSGTLPKHNEFNSQISQGGHDLAEYKN